MMFYIYYTYIVYKHVYNIPYIIHIKYICIYVYISIYIDIAYSICACMYIYIPIHTLLLKREK